MAGNSIVANERLITKIYFPRLHVPFSAVGSALFDLIVAQILLVIMMLIFGVVPGWRLAIAPLAAGMMIIAAMGIGAFLAALVAAQRDFRYILGFMIQLWMFATPAIYRPIESLGQTAQWLLPINPCHGLVENFRQAILNQPLNWYSFGVSSGMAIVIAVIGLAYFKRVERTFADVI
ncbi:MAG: ABC transporter permease [Zavarzinella sp.]